MKKLIIGLLLLLFAFGVGYLLQRDSGYVLLSYGHWAVEMSLWVAVIISILLFLFIYLCIRFFKHTSHIGDRFQSWSQQRQGQKANSLTNIGLCQLAEGQWRNAESNLLKGAKTSPTPLINYLAAARAAQGSGDYDRRDQHLRNAHHANKEAQVAISLTQAHLQIEAAQWEQALATLQRLQQIVPNHKAVLKLLMQVYVEVHDWRHLHEMLPSIQKQKLLSEDQLETLCEQCYTGLLQQAQKSKSLEQIQNAWSAIPRSWQSNLEIVRTYALALIDLQATHEAMSIIERTMKHQFDQTLVKYYGLTIDGHGSHQLQVAEGWLRKYPNSPELLLCLGRLSIREKFWGKARDYLESSIQISPSIEAYLELGRALEALGEKDTALEYYRKSVPW